MASVGDRRTHTRPLRTSIATPPHGLNSFRSSESLRRMSASPSPGPGLQSMRSSESLSRIAVPRSARKYSSGVKAPTEASLRRIGADAGGRSNVRRDSNGVPVFARPTQASLSKQPSSSALSSAKSPAPGGLRAAKSMSQLGDSPMKRAMAQLQSKLDADASSQGAPLRERNVNIPVRNDELVKSDAVDDAKTAMDDAKSSATSKLERTLGFGGDSYDDSYDDSLGSPSRSFSSRRRSSSRGSSPASDKARASAAGDTSLTGLGLDLPSLRDLPSSTPTKRTQGAKPSPGKIRSPFLERESASASPVTGAVRSDRFERVDKSDKVDKSDDKVDKSDDKVDKSDDKVDKSDDKIDKSADNSNKNASMRHARSFVIDRPVDTVSKSPKMKHMRSFDTLAAPAPASSSLPRATGSSIKERAAAFTRALQQSQSGDLDAMPGPGPVRRDRSFDESITSLSSNNESVRARNTSTTSVRTRTPPKSPSSKTLAERKSQLFERSKAAEHESEHRPGGMRPSESMRVSSPKPVSSPNDTQDSEGLKSSLTSVSNQQSTPSKRATLLGTPHADTHRMLSPDQRQRSPTGSSGVGVGPLASPSSASKYSPRMRPTHIAADDHDRIVAELQAEHAAAIDTARRDAAAAAEETVARSHSTALKALDEQLEKVHMRAAAAEERMLTLDYEHNEEIQRMKLTFANETSALRAQLAKEKDEALHKMRADLLSDQRSQSAGIVDERDALMGERDALVMAHEQALYDREDVAAQLKALKTEHRRVLDELKERQQQLEAQPGPGTGSQSHWEEDYAALEQDYREISDAYAKLREDHARLKSSAVLARASRSSDSEEGDSSAEDVKSLQALVDDLTRERDHLQSSRAADAESLYSLATVKTELAHATAALEVKDAQISGLEAHVESLERKLNALAPAQRDLAEIIKENEDLHAQLQLNAEAHAAELAHVDRDRQAALDGLIASVTELEQQVAFASQSAAEEIERERDSHAHVLAGLQARADDLQRSVDDHAGLRTHIDALEAQLAELRTSERSMRSSKDQLSDALESLASEKGLLESRLQQIEQLVDDKDTQIQELLSRRVDSDQLELLEKQLADKDVSHGDRVAELQSAIDQHQRELADKDMSHGDRVAELQSAIDQHQRELADKDMSHGERIAELQSAIDQHQRELADKDASHNDRIAELQAAISQLTTSHEAALTTQRELQSVADSKHQLITSTQGRLAEIEEENHALLDRIEALTGELEQLAEEERERDALLAEQEKTARALWADAEVSRARAEAQERHIDELTASFAHEKQQLEEDLEHHRAECHGMAAALAELESQLAGTRDHNDALMQDLHSHQMTIDSLTQDASTARELTESARTELENAKAEMDSLRQSIVRERLELDELAGVIDARDSDLAAREAAVDQREAAIENERAAIDDARVSLETQQVAAERTRAALDEERTTLEQERASLNEAYAALDRDRESLEAHRAALDTHHAALEAHHEQLERNGADLVQVKRDLDEQLNTFALTQEQHTQAALELESKRTFLDTQAESFERLMQSMDKDRGELDARTRDIEARERSVEALRAELTEHNRDIMARRDSLDKDRSEHLSAREAFLTEQNELHAAKAAFAQELAAHKRDIEESLTHATRTLEARESNAAERELHMDTREHALQALEEELAQKLEQMKHLGEQRARLDEDVAQLVRNKQALDKVRDDLFQQKEALDAIRRDLQQQRDSVLKQKQDLADKAKDLDSRTSDFDRHLDTAVSTRHKSLLDDHTALRSGHDKLKAELAATSNELSVAIDRAAQLQAKLDDAPSNDALTAARAEVASLQAKIAEMESDFGRAAMLDNTRLETIAQLEEELEQVRAQTEAHTSRINELAAATHHSETTQSSLAKQRAAFERDLEQFRSQSAQELEAARAATAEAVTNADTANAQLRALHADLDSSRKQAQLHARRVADLSAQAARSEELQEQITQLQHALASRSDASDDDLERRMHVIRQEAVQDAYVHVQEIKAQHEQALKALAHATSRADAIKRELVDEIQSLRAQLKAERSAHEASNARIQQMSLVA